MKHAFDEFLIDVSAHELRVRGEPVAIEPKVFDVLLHLIENNNRVVSKDELIEVVWQGRFISDAAVSTAISALRRALGDDGQGQRYIRTVRGRGVQFVAMVATERTAHAAARDEALEPALAVRAYSPEPEIAARTRVLENRLRTILTRVPVLQIAGPIQSDGEGLDILELRSRYGLTHVAEISMSQDGDDLLVDASLIETRQGLQNWARSFKANGSQPATEPLVNQLVSQLEPALMKAMISGLTAEGGDDEPVSLMLRAVGTLAMRGWNVNTFREAESLLLASIDGRRDLALAHAYLSLILALGHRVGVSRDNPETIPRAISAAETALGLENQESGVLGIAGCALCDAGHVGRGMPLIDLAIELNPENGQAKCAKGAALILEQDPAGAVTWLRDGMKVSPADPRLSVWGGILAMAELANGDIDRALETATVATSRDDRNYIPRLALAAVHAMRGDQLRLEHAILEVLRTLPAISENEILYFVGKRLSAMIWPALCELRASSRPIP